MKINPASRPWKKTRAFTLVEIICVVVLIGLLGSIGVALMRDTATTGRTNVLAKNASELNNAVNNLRAAGTVFAQGTYAFTNGSATGPANVVLPADATVADTASFITQLAGAGITSFGNTAGLGRAITAASYTYTWTNGAPVFAVVAGATTP